MGPGSTPLFPRPLESPFELAYLLHRLIPGVLPPSALPAQAPLWSRQDGSSCSGLCMCPPRLLLPSGGAQA